jgi:hypothetical protein
MSKHDKPDDSLTLDQLLTQMEGLAQAMLKLNAYQDSIAEGLHQLDGAVQVLATGLPDGIVRLSDNVERLCDQAQRAIDQLVWREQVAGE